MQEVVICGGGIIGCSTAYHLAKKGIKSTIVDRVGIACAASGKAGCYPCGFLARDWSDGTEIAELSRKSFDVHMKLMEEFPDCDYRKLDTMAVTLQEGSNRKGSLQMPKWMDGPITNCSNIGDTSTTAQVHPFKLTSKFFEKAKELVGTDVKIGTVEGIEKSANKTTGVLVSGEVIPANAVIIAMGPWTGQCNEWLKTPKFRGHRAHSIILKPKNDVTPHALFLEYADSSGRRSPEIYPRPDSTVYVCGMSDDVCLPDDPAQVKPNAESCKKLKHMCNTLSCNLSDSTVEAEQACYLPISPYGIPVIGKVPGVEGAYLASGHSCWGILNAPATGAALAELIVDGHCSLLDLSPFDPSRFMN